MIIEVQHILPAVMLIDPSSRKLITHSLPIKITTVPKFPRHANKFTTIYMPIESSQFQDRENDDLSVQSVNTGRVNDIEGNQRLEQLQSIFS